MATPPKKAPTYPRLRQFGELLQVEDAPEPILAPELGEALLEWLEEIWSAKLLAEVGLEPRRKAMFGGAPGTGKTTLAHHLAGRLGLPMLAVRTDTLIDKYLGQSNQNIGALFDAAKPKAEGGEGPVILFFDEFEAIGSSRKANAENAQREMNGVVSFLLQCFERHKGYLIAATNLVSEIDPALWRRFDFHLTFEAPQQRERELILERYLSPFGLPPAALSALAEACETASPAIMRKLCEGLKRAFAIGKKLKWDMRREPIFERVLQGIEPHADLGKPRLWSHRGKDKALALIPWPMPKAVDLPALAVAPPSAGADVVSLPTRRSR